MSRIADQLYFAPNVRFADLDLTGKCLPTQFKQRIDGFYLKPALCLAKANHAFAAGVLVVCAIDALALIMTGSTGVTSRIKGFCTKIPELADDQIATTFCDHFRNGLVHEARVKDGSEFSVDIQRVAIATRGRLTVHPGLLAGSVRGLLNDFVKGLDRSPSDKHGFIKKLKRTFRYELQN